MKKRNQAKICSCVAQKKDNIGSYFALGRKSSGCGGSRATKSTFEERCGGGFSLCYLKSFQHFVHGQGDRAVGKLCD